MPAVAVLAAAVAGATSSVALFSESVGFLHGALHAHEIWILAMSAFLVLLGGVLELSARRGGARRGFPWLYAFSIACFVANVAILGLHRG